MSILVNKDTRIVVQGLTGREGMFHTEKMIEYGTRIVAGVTPGKAGQTVLGVPVFDRVADAVRETGAEVSIVFVPAAFAADAACEASEAGCRLVVVITEHIPVMDMIRVKSFLNARGTLMIGPNCPGIITPEECKLGIMPGYIHKKGSVGLLAFVDSKIAAMRAAGEIDALVAKWELAPVDWAQIDGFATTLWEEAAKLG